MLGGLKAHQAKRIGADVALSDGVRPHRAARSVYLIFTVVWIVGTSKHERKLKPFKFVLLESLCQFGRLTGRGSSECLSDLVFHLTPQ